MFEILDNRMVAVKIYGKDFSLRRPTFGEITALQEKYDGTDTRSQVAMTKAVLTKCGLSSEFLDEMVTEDVLMLFEFLAGTKKK